MIDEKLPTHYSTPNNIINIYETKEYMARMAQLGEVLIKLDEEDKEAKTITSTTHYQDFDLYHLMGLVR